jgi:tetratricopeptide (TPR) repeat protein
MKTRKSASWLCATWLLLAAVGATQADQVPCGQARNAAAGGLDEPTWRRLNAIHAAVGEERYDEAYEELHHMLDQARRDAYLQAVIYQALAQVEWERGHLEAAQGFFETALELDVLPDSVHYALMYQVAQLYYTSGRLDEALERLDVWFCSVPPEEHTSSAWVLKASILSRQGEFAGALEAIDAAIDLEESPPEPWYQLKLAAQYELRQYERAVETLEAMLSRWPERKRYWVQLSQAHYALGKDERALAAQALAYRSGLLDEASEILFLAGLYTKLRLPYKAASVLEQGIRDRVLAPDRAHWAQVAEAWRAAGELERSLAAWEAAGRVADDGLTDLHRGYLLAELERWPAALEALNQAFARGGLDDRRTGEAHLLRGMVRFSLGDFEGAGADWGQAGRLDSSREAARQWLSYLREEQRRQAS